MTKTSKVTFKRDGDSFKLKSVTNRSYITLADNTRVYPGDKISRETLDLYSNYANSISTIALVVVG